MAQKLTNRDFCDAAKLLKCGPSEVQAVAEVESRQSGFDSQGRVVILFERHKFYKYADSRYRNTWAAKYPAICNPNSGGYNSGGSQYQRFNLAFSLDPVAAMMACSWGKFQVMGFNFAVAGYRNVHEFVDAMKTGERAHLLAFVNFVIANGIDDELRRHDWAGFAYRYNGSGYKRNAYDTKMAAAYRKFSKDPIDCQEKVNDVFEAIDAVRTDLPTREESVAAGASHTLPEPDESRGPTAVTPTAAPPETESRPESRPPTDTLTTITQGAKQVEAAAEQLGSAGDKLGGVSRSSWFVTLITWFGGAGASLQGFVEQNPARAAVYIIAGIVILGLALWYLTRSKERATAQRIAAVEVLK